MTLWKMILMLEDGLMYVFDSAQNLVDIFTIGFTDNIRDLDGNGEKIVDKFERGRTSDGQNYYSVILSDEVDENEDGQIPVF